MGQDCDTLQPCHRLRGLADLICSNELLRNNGEKSNLYFHSTNKKTGDKVEQFIKHENFL